MHIKGIALTIFVALFAKCLSEQKISINCKHKCYFKSVPSSFFIKQLILPLIFLLVNLEFPFCFQVEVGDEIDVILAVLWHTVASKIIKRSVEAISMVQL